MAAIERRKGECTDQKDLDREDYSTKLRMFLNIEDFPIILDLFFFLLTSLVVAEKETGISTTGEATGSSE